MEDLRLLNQRIISCRLCPRLVEYRESVAQNKVKRFSYWNYWGKPLPGFGDPEAKLLIIGLAPAAHGGNRTGRMFTGDSSGEWLVKALYETGFANQPTSISKDDGLQLRSAYITASLRCAPPQNKPTRAEIDKCSGYLKEELKILKDVKVVLTLGKIAFDAYLKSAQISRKPKFVHGSIHNLREDLPTLMISFHPSKQNTQTNRLTWGMWIEIFMKVRKLIDA